MADWVFVAAFAIATAALVVLSWIAAGCPGHPVVTEQPRRFLWPLPPQTSSSEPPADADA